MATMKSEKVKEFWNKRSVLKEKAGTNDLIAKWLEMRTLVELCHKFLDKKQSRNVLDVGCGNGMTLIHLALEMGMEAVGVDFAPEMVREAQAAWKVQYKNSALSMIDFQVNDVLTMERYNFPSKFDLAYTERTLINLGTWKTQSAAISQILTCVKRGGVYLMMENSADGLAQINAIRAESLLPKIEAPWHNRYMDDVEILALKDVLLKAKVAELESIINYSSTYYYLSRIVNAKIAANEGVEPEYLSDINKLAMDLPPLPGFLGQGRVWVWRRIG